jgi:diguanylate cyclase (GGDEF)-like protein
MTQMHGPDPAQRRIGALGLPLADWALLSAPVVLAAVTLGPAAAVGAAALAAPAIVLTRHRGRAGTQAAATTPRDTAARDPVTGLPLRAEVVAMCDAAFAAAPTSGQSTACFVIGIDDAAELVGRHGQLGYEQLLGRVADALKGALRDRDLLARLEGARFAVALGPVRRIDLEAAIQIAGRLQATLHAPVSLDAASVHLSASVGFCLAARAPAASGAALLAAAEVAGEEAARNGPGGIRAFSVEVERAAQDRTALRDAVEAALEGGQIVAHFQPQISTDTGAVAGFEVLARWNHPGRGLLAPAEFLPAIEGAGLMERLSELMIHQALTALRSWDRAGHRIPTAGVNFAREELGNPRLAERVKWELDRFEIAPARLTVEVLESVIATTEDDVIVRNIAALARMGCGIDLDDFGTGHASIASIRRFDVHRIKIDRSFVMRVDTDPAQQRMLSAILSMAERLNLATLAEGVESLSEHAMLAQLGCTHVQGFGIARPMPFEDTLPWLEAHRAKLTATPRVGRRAS